MDPTVAVHKKIVVQKFQSFHPYPNFKVIQEEEV